MQWLMGRTPAALWPWSGTWHMPGKFKKNNNYGKTGKVELRSFKKPRCVTLPAHHKCGHTCLVCGRISTPWKSKHPRSACVNSRKQLTDLLPASGISTSRQHQYKQGNTSCNHFPKWFPRTCQPNRLIYRKRDIPGLHITGVTAGPRPPESGSGLRLPSFTFQDVSCCWPPGCCRPSCTFISLPNVFSTQVLQTLAGTADHHTHHGEGG